MFRVVYLTFKITLSISFSSASRTYLNEVCIQSNSERLMELSFMESTATDNMAESKSQKNITANPNITGAEILIRCLNEENVKFVFGYPGGAVLHIYDEIYKQNGFKHILVRHEQAAVHAADAFSRATGEVGVAIVTSGPGATNAVTGIATAYMDSIPLVVISGQVPVPAIGMDAFQEVDMVGITRPCVKHNFLVKDVKDIAATMKKAFYIAASGRPGPVVVDIPKDITAHLTEYIYPKTLEMRSYNPVLKGHSGQIKKAVKLLLEAKRPMIYTGGGLVLGDASPELVKLARALNYPVTNTLMGLGGYPATDKQFVGMLGMHGSYEANMAMQNCDVLIAVGARFDDRVIGNPGNFQTKDRTIIHIDVDPSSISKRVKVDVPIVGHVQSVLREMNEILALENKQNNIADWWKQIDEWRTVKSMVYQQSTEFIKPQYVIEKLWEVTKGNAYVTTDVGQHQMWAAQYYKFDQPRRWINSGGLGTMGVGLPYAMGCQFADKNAQVACVTGEGSIQMNIQELSTCAQYGLPIKVILLNNRYLGMVRQWQEFFYENRYSESYMDSLPDFVKLAESYGHIGMQITNPADVESALVKAFSPELKDRFVFMDFITDQSENVFPMIPNGAGLAEMILGKEQKLVDNHTREED